MSEPAYVYTPRPGEWLQVETNPAGCQVVITNGGGVGTATVVAVPLDETPKVARQIAAAMHEAVGLEPPLILEWPEYESRSYDLGSDIAVHLRDNGGIALHADEVMTHLTARALASRLAYLAHVAENEPGPADVDALTRIIRSSMPGMAVPCDGDYRTAVAREQAKAILAAGYRPPGISGAAAT